MAKEPYNWLDDPFDPEKERQEQEIMRHQKGCGWAAVAALVIVVLIVGGGLFGIGTLLSSVLA